MTKIINQSIKENTFPTEAKIASVLPFFKKDIRLLKSNYRPVSVLNTISKIFERVMKDQIMNYMNKLLSPYVSAYRKNYSSQHVLMRLLEEWREGLDSGEMVGAVLMDLSKAFDCIPHDLLIAKLHFYGFDKNALKYIYSYLKGRQQCVKINEEKSNFLKILSGVPQGSILGPILFNIFINDLNYHIQKASLHGFADDHTISAKSKRLEDLKDILCKDSNKAIEWLDENSMIANPSKFQAIVFSKTRNFIETEFKIKDKVIKSEESVRLLGITIDYKLKFNTHISDVCIRAGGQLNALYRLKRYLTKDSKKLSINSFIMSNFNYCPLIWHFTDYNSNQKIETLQKRAYKFLNLNNDCIPENKEEDKMETKRLRTLAIEIFKTKNNLNPIFMKEIFKPNINQRSQRLKHNLQVPKHNQVTFGRKSLRVLGPKLWNNLPIYAKTLTTLPHFKRFIKTWGDKNCIHYKKFVSYDNATK